jgi:hypothetical protein
MLGLPNYTDSCKILGKCVSPGSEQLLRAMTSAKMLEDDLD